MFHNATDTLNYNSKAKSLLSGKRIGLITNPTGVDRFFVPTFQKLASFCKPSAFFGPEHGISGTAQAGVKVQSTTDPLSGIPVYSMYDKTGVAAEALNNLDALVYDIQDVGLRFYTYIYTLSDAMKLAASAGIPVIVLDRYNPLGLTKAEGTLLDERFSSGVGRFELPSRYAMTVGEYARYINREKGINCDLTVIECENLRRDSDPEPPCGSWVFPSPNIPTYESIYPYAATVLFEGTNLSEGRGTAKPFELFGAPWLRITEILHSLSQKSLPGCLLRPCEFVPTFSKHSDYLCRGFQLHVTDRKSFEPFRVGLTILDEIRKTHDEFDFLYWPKSDVYFIDRLLGSDEYRKKSPDVDTFISKEQKKVDAFMKNAEQYFLYD